MKLPLRVLFFIFWAIIVLVLGFFVLWVLGYNTEPIIGLLLLFAGGVWAWRQQIQIIPTPPPTNRTAKTVKELEHDYLYGRLKQFEEEEALFIPLEMQPFSLDYRSADEIFDTIEKVVKRYERRFVLVGNPGSGKSTTLRYLFRDHARAYLNDADPERQLPLWIDLGLSDTPKDADELIQDWWTRYDLPATPDAYIKHYKLAFYLDGLNELALDTRKERAESLRNYIAKLVDDFSVIITCRVHDYRDDADLKMGTLPMVEVKPLTLEQTQEFIRKRLKSDADAMALWNTLQTQKTLLALAENPYYLTMLIEIHPNIPEDLNDLFEQYFTRAYDNYTQRYTVSLGRKEELTPLVKPQDKLLLERRLKLLAFRMLAYGGGTTVNQIWLNRPMQRFCIGEQTITDGINMGFLQENRETLRFYHHALHGYFAVELLSDALQIRGGFDRFTKNPLALIRLIGDLQSAGAPAVPVLQKKLYGRDMIIASATSEALVKISTELLVATDWALIHVYTNTNGETI
jgi:hypothetical protein